MSNLDKLNTQINNLKDLDLNELIAKVQERTNTLIKIALIAGSLLLAGLMFNNQSAKDKALSVQMSQVQVKLQAIKDHDAAVQNLNNFKSTLPKKFDVFELITQIQTYAKSYHINILSLSPAEKQDMGLYDLIKIDFSAESDNFKDMVLFLRKIEKSKSFLRIDSWVGRTSSEGKISFTIKFSSVSVHP